MFEIKRKVLSLSDYIITCSKLEVLYNKTILLVKGNIGKEMVFFLK